MKLKERTCSILFGICNIFHVLSLKPFLTDNSSERYNTKDGSWTPGETNRELQWAKVAFEYVHNLKCESVFFTTGKECRKLVLVPQSAMNIYVAPATSGHGKYRTILPDNSLPKKESHEGVLVVDPYPKASFGHLVIVFFIDKSNRYMCKVKKGLYIESTQDCMTLALKRRCKNAIKRNTRRKHFARRCEINFLPVVHINSNPSRELYMEHRFNYLKCWDKLEGFGRCPELRPLNETTHLICNPIRDNTKRCSTTHELVHTNCRIFEICDQGVIISGGWNRETSGVRFKNNAQAFYWMLRQYGYKKRNIKIFFANGASGMNTPSEHPHQVHPAAMKLALRYHIQTLCRSPHCVDTLVLYLNSPSKNDGTVLLWDVNSDGVAESNEQYLLSELKEDLSHCTARKVHMIVDQSYSGHIADSFKGSNDHRNVVVFASGRDNEYSYDDEFTRHWVTSNHTHDCTWNVNKQSKNIIKNSSPEVGEGSNGEVRTTIFGAPCNVKPPFSHRELRDEYLGCQPLPTALWIQKLLHSPEKYYGGSDSSAYRFRTSWRRR